MITIERMSIENVEKFLWHLRGQPRCDSQEILPDPKTGKGSKRRRKHHGMECETQADPFPIRCLDAICVDPVVCSNECLRELRFLGKFNNEDAVVIIDKALQMIADLRRSVIQIREIEVADHFAGAEAVHLFPEFWIVFAFDEIVSDYKQCHCQVSCIGATGLLTESANALVW
ncbi:hypothetical protein GOL39_11805 [Sinorhizobium medicae]|nr:hypothetical protein [Sinorhizobium medicae]